MNQPDDTTDGYQLIQQQRAQSAGEATPATTQERLETAQALAVDSDQRLRESILAPTGIPEGWKLVALSPSQTELGEIQSVAAPGWVALNLPNLSVGIVAFVPSYWMNGSDVEVSRVQGLWAAECVGTTSLEDAAEKIATIRNCSGTSGTAASDGDLNPLPSQGLDTQVLPGPEQDSLYKGAP